jgi:hypothetical protein
MAGWPKAGTQWRNPRQSHEMELNMSTVPVYSSLFSCLYDEPSPVGHLGRGTHYSVLRSIEWLDVIRSPLAAPQVHDFAVIWDEDHDLRVIKAIEAIYMSGLLSPVQFIGERKGVLTVIVAARYYFHGAESVIADYGESIRKIAANISIIGDSWSSDIGSFDRVQLGEHQCITHGIINDSDFRILTYLRNIDSLWNLGTKDYFPGI